MKSSSELKDLATALSKAQGQLKPASKDGVNPHFKSSYSTLQSVWDSCRAILTANGLSVAQTFAEGPEGAVTVQTTLLHSSGQWISGDLVLKSVKNDPQGIGSAITYGRRYALAAIVGIVSDEDDDANSASHAPAPRQASTTLPAANLAPISKVNKDYLETIADGSAEEKALVANVLTKTGAKDIASIPEAKAVKAVAWVKEQLAKINSEENGNPY